MKKNIVRKITIILLAVICIIVVILKFKIEPASYKKSLKKQIIRAEDLVSRADIGNSKGEYSNFVILDFKNQIKAAKEVANDKDSYYDIEKSSYKQLKESIKDFKDNKNKNCISKDNVEKLKDELNKSVKTTVLNSKQKVIWTINGKNIRKSDAINLDVKSRSPYTNRIDEYIERLKLDCNKISFYHNGRLPGKIKIYVNYKYDNDKDRVYLYKFNENNNTLKYKCQVAINSSKVEFFIDEGGDYILLKNKLEDYASSNEIKNISEEIKQNENKLDLKDVEEKIQKDDTTSKNISDKDTASINKTNDKSNNDSKSKNDNNTDEQSKSAVNSTQTDNTSNNTKNNQAANAGSQMANNQTSNNAQVNNKVTTCTIEIRCDTLAGTGKLKAPNKEKYVPSDGIILKKTTVTIDEGKTVYDVLLSVCRNNEIQIDAEYTQMYSSYYVKGINYLYQYDAGDLSGWMYRVNGDFPNYGCSEYKVKNGDAISFLYSCDMGTDVGENHSDWEK